MNEIAEQLELPPALARNAASHGYYGTVSHDSKAVYNYYLGYFDGNPAHLNPLPPVEAARKYVEYMGGADEVLRKAGIAFARGDYRWVAEVVNHVVFAFPENRRAREVEADALEQLGYQAESASWRNIYLTGAQELRQGVNHSAVGSVNPTDLVRATPPDLLLDYAAIQLNSIRAAGKTLRIELNFSDAGEHFLVTVQNSVLNHWKDRPGAECAVTLTRAQFSTALVDHARAAEIPGQDRCGRFRELLGMLDPFDRWFNIVTR